MQKKQDRLRTLQKIKKDLQDFELCLIDANGNVAIAFDNWLKEHRLLGVLYTVSHWVNMNWNEEEVRRDLQDMYRLIDEEIQKIEEEV